MKQNTNLRKVKYLFCWVAFLTLMASCSKEPASILPWSLQGRTIPPFQIIDTDEPVTAQYVITYTVEAAVAKNSSRDDIEVISEKIIEGLPKHNSVIIYFLADPSERGKGFTVAKTDWGPEYGVHDDSLLVAGDYSKNVMRITMKGEEPPGQVVEKY